MNKMSDLYELLKIDRNANTNDIKKAYRKLALRYHPDKNLNDKNATEKFQELTRAAEVLMNPRLREYYDKNGEIVNEEFATAYEYWRNLFGEITSKDLEEFEKQYKNSQEEHDDIINGYKKSNGDMKAVVEEVYVPTFKDLQRYKNIIENAIENKELEFSKKFKRTYNKIYKQFEKEEKLVEEMNNENKEQTNSNVSLEQMILQKHQSQKNTWLDGLESKYGNKSKKKKKNMAPPSDDEFERIQQEMLKRSKKVHH